MPVFKSGKGLSPSWCELEYFEIVNLKPGSKHIFNKVWGKEKLIVGKGRCKIRFANQVKEVSEAANMDIVTERDRLEVVDTLTETTFIRMCGRWRDEIGGSGIFRVEKSVHPQDKGDAVDYPKQTSFDNHYHDCDEYWIVFEGRGIVVSERKRYEVGPGDCVATGMGHHHDFPIVYKSVKAIFFETTMEGQKRPGHLWEHKHGKAIPKMDRV